MNLMRQWNDFTTKGRDNDSIILFYFFFSWDEQVFIYLFFYWRQIMTEISEIFTMIRIFPGTNRFFFHKGRQEFLLSEGFSLRMRSYKKSAVEEYVSNCLLCLFCCLIMFDCFHWNDGVNKFTNVECYGK